MANIDPKLLKAFGVVQIIGGVTCIASLTFLFIYGIYPQELSILYFQMACGATGVINILLGLESCLWMPKENRGTRNALIFDIIVSIMLAIVLVTTALLFKSVYLSGDTIMDSAADLWDETQIEVFRVCFMLALAASIILFISLIFSAFLLYKNNKLETE